jgi:hypothetical protein
MLTSEKFFGSSKVYYEIQQSWEIFEIEAYRLVFPGKSARKTGWEYKNRAVDTARPLYWGRNNYFCSFFLFSW